MTAPPQLAPGVRRPAAGLLVGGSPLRVLRLSPGGSDVLDALLKGDPDERAATLEQRLVEAGLLLRAPGPASLAEVTVVVPVRGRAEEVQVVLDSLPSGVPVVVVDDGSPSRIDLQRDGVLVLRHPRSAGPAAARNTGAAQVRTDLVAFVDAGVALPEGALERLTGHFHDPRVSAAAPRVVSGAARGWTGVLEQQLCALDQGGAAAQVRPQGAVSYVPSAVLLVRRSALERAGGFDEQLSVGEDVDLVWRLSQQGVVRYDPEVVARHAPRARLLPALLRRRDYGRSAGPLDRRHPGQLRHLRVSAWSLLPWAVAAVSPAAALATAGALVVAAPRRLTELPPTEARRLALAGQWASFGAVGRYAVRPGWPLLAAAWAWAPSRRLATSLSLAYVVGSRARLLGGPPRDLPARAVLSVLDDLAYSAGAWQSARQERRWRVLLPAFIRRAPRSAPAGPAVRP